VADNGHSDRGEHREDADPDLAAGGGAKLGAGEGGNTARIGNEDSSSPSAAPQSRPRQSTAAASLTPLGCKLGS